MKLKPKTFAIKRKSPYLHYEDKVKRLEAMTQEAKTKALKNILTDEEMEDYLFVLDVYSQMLERKANGDDSLLVDINIENGRRRLYNHEKRLFAQDIDDTSNINRDDYEKDVITNTVGYKDKVLEKLQIENQSDTDWSANELDAINAWAGINYDKINNYLYDTPDFRNLIKFMEERNSFQAYIQDIIYLVENLQSAINKTKGLTQYTTLYRGGIMDRNIGVGDISSFKGFVSTSYQKNSAEGFYGDDYPENYLITILAPKGTKGIAVGGENGWTAWSHEHEFLLNLDQKYQVIDIDHTAQTATIMLIND